MPRLLAALVVVVATACAGDGPTSVETADPATSPAGPVTTALPASPPAPDRDPDPDPVPAPAPHGVPLGQVFSIEVGESVDVIGEGLTVVYRELLADSRCPIGVQCIAAGDASIALDVTKEDSPPATLVLHTDDEPSAGAYLDYTVELVQLDRGPAPVARLKVT